MMEVVERYRLIEAAMRKDIDPMFADLPTDSEDKNRYIVLTALSYLAELIEVLRIKVTESRPL